MSGCLLWGSRTRVCRVLIVFWQATAQATKHTSWRHHFLDCSWQPQPNNGEQSWTGTTGRAIITSKTLWAREQRKLSRSLQASFTPWHPEMICTFSTRHNLSWLESRCCGVRVAAPLSQQNRKKIGDWARYQDASCNFHPMPSIFISSNIYFIWLHLLRRGVMLIPTPSL